MAVLDWKAVLSSDARNALPDSAFACPEKRLYPHHHADGSIDMNHLRNALSRVAQQATSSCGVEHLRAHARANDIGDDEKGLHSSTTEPHDARVAEVKAFTPIDLDLKDTGDIVVAFSRLLEVDHDSDVTFRGAIPTKSLPMSDFGHTSWPQRGSRPPVGRGDIKEDGDLGVFRGRFFMKTTQGANAYETVSEMKELQEWSYGFDVLDFIPKPKEYPKAKRGLKALDIHEISPVLLGAGLSTATLGIKELDGDLLVGSFTEQRDRVLAALKELQGREEEIVDLRLKEGRAISADRRKRLAEQRDLLAALLEGTDRLLVETEPKPQAGEGEHVADLGKSRLLTARAQLHAELSRRGYELPATS